MEYIKRIPHWLTVFSLLSWKYIYLYYILKYVRTRKIFIDNIDRVTTEYLIFFNDFLHSQTIFDKKSNWNSNIREKWLNNKPEKMKTRLSILYVYVQSLVF